GRIRRGGRGHDARGLRRAGCDADERARGRGRAHLGPRHAAHRRPWRVCGRPRLPRARRHPPLGPAPRFAASGDTAAGRTVAGAGRPRGDRTGRFPDGGGIHRPGVLAVLPAGGDRIVRAASARPRYPAAVPGPAVSAGPAAVLRDQRLPAVRQPRPYRAGRAGRRRRAGAGRTAAAVPRPSAPATGVSTMTTTKSFAVLLLYVSLLSACNGESPGAATHQAPSATPP